MNAQIIFSSLVIFLVMTFFGFLTENYVSGGFILDKRERDKKPHLIKSWKETANLYGPHNIVRIIVPAILVAAVSCFTAMSSWWLNVIFAITIFGVYVIYAKGFFVALSRWREIFVLLPLLIAPLIVLLTVTKNIMAVVKNSFWASVICPFIPWAIFTIVVLGAFVFFFRRRAKDFENKGEHESAKRERAFSVIVAVLLVLALLLEGFFLIAWPKSDSSNPDPGPQPTWWCHFYNDDLQADEDEANDWYFAQDYYQKGMSANELKAKHRELMLTDPTNGTPAMCWVDKHIGTRYMGDKFYDEYEADDAAINSAKEVYAMDQKLYNDTMTSFLSCLDQAVVEVRDIKKGSLKDQMYQIPSRMSVRGIPDVAVFESGEQGGHYLVYIFTIKGRVVEVAFRIECGFQPTNVTKYLKVTVKEKPKPDTSSGGSGGSKSTTKSETTTKPAKKPSGNRYSKDPKKSNSSGKNDNTGPGANTNNGVGSNTSAAQASSGSTGYSSPEDFKKKTDQLAVFNNDPGSNNNTGKPSTSTPNSTVDNNYSQVGDNADQTKEKVSGTKNDPNASQWSGPDD